jgi:hypothetical protein
MVQSVGDTPGFPERAFVCFLFRDVISHEGAKLASHIYKICTVPIQGSGVAIGTCCRDDIELSDIGYLVISILADLVGEYPGGALSAELVVDHVLHDGAHNSEDVASLGLPVVPLLEVVHEPDPELAFVPAFRETAVDVEERVHFGRLVVILVVEGVPGEHVLFPGI